jgi:hypothetical protein
VLFSLGFLPRELLRTDAGIIFHKH